MSKVAIIGMGFVGKGMLTLFPDALQIDKGAGPCYADTAGCELAIVCVPTPMSSSGACDTSIVEEVVPQLQADVILIRSTVAPGTCDRLAAATGKRIVFAPEYMGESKYFVPVPYMDPRNPISHGFMVLGGEDADCSIVTDLFMPVMGPTTRFRFMTRMEAEIVKYCENSYFAVKVTFANQVRQICEAAGVNYHRVREGWLDDPRIGPMHSAAFKRAPGFDGKCLPKDTAALAAYCRELGLQPTLLDATLQQNAATRLG